MVATRAWPWGSPAVRERSTWPCYREAVTANRVVRRGRLTEASCEWALREADALPLGIGRVEEMGRGEVGEAWVVAVYGVVTGAQLGGDPLGLVGAAAAEGPFDVHVFLGDRPHNRERTDGIPVAPLLDPEAMGERKEGGVDRDVAVRTVYVVVALWCAPVGGGVDRRGSEERFGPVDVVTGPVDRMD